MRILIPNKDLSLIGGAIAAPAGSQLVIRVVTLGLLWRPWQKNISLT